MDFDVQSPSKALREDKGYASRKLWMTILTMALIVGLAFLSALAGFVALGPNLGTVIGGLIGCLALYLGANAVVKHSAAGVAKEQVRAAAPPKKVKSTKTNGPPVEQG